MCFSRPPPERFRGVDNTKWDDEIGVIPMGLNLDEDEIHRFRKRVERDNGIPYWDYGGCYAHVRHVLRTHLGVKDINLLGREMFLLDGI